VETSVATSPFKLSLKPEAQVFSLTL